MAAEYVSFSNSDTEIKPMPSERSTVNQEEKNVPRPAMRKSKITLNTVEDFVAYGESFLRSPAKYNEEATHPPHSPRKPLRKGKIDEIGAVKDNPVPMDDKNDISSYDEEESDEDKQTLTQLGINIPNEFDSEDVAVAETDKLSPYDEDKEVLSVIIAIHSLSLAPFASVVKNENVKMLYVEYRFLDYPLEELETPFSLPKPLPPQVISFNFSKVFPFHPTNSIDKWKLLAAMFDTSTPEASWIKFTVVSEPTTEQQDLDCEDVGYAYVDLREIFTREKDIVQEDTEIYDAKDQKSVIGTLNITVQALHVLQMLQATKL